MGFKPSKEEQLWAKKEDFELRKKLREYMISEKQKSAEIVEHLCPCGGGELEMLEIEETGILVYNCPNCGGLWIKRVEAEKLFQSNSAAGKLVRHFSKIFNIQI